MARFVPGDFVEARLRTLREVYGTPAASEVALLDSGVWTWPGAFKVTGHQRREPRQEGKRLLGLRVDGYDRGKRLTLSLLNAGGSANGEAIGAATVRYSLSENQTQLLPLQPAP